MRRDMRLLHALGERDWHARALDEPEYLPERVQLIRRRTARRWWTTGRRT
jgi:hypothetical protein